MARLNAADEDALRQFADRCGCTLEQLRHAIQARSVNEMDVISFLSLRGYISKDAFLRMRTEIT
jgi:hypothetical protein